jgi:hypothetical protein
MACGAIPESVPEPLNTEAPGARRFMRRASRSCRSFLKNNIHSRLACQEIVDFFLSRVRRPRPGEFNRAPRSSVRGESPHGRPWRPELSLGSCRERPFWPPAAALNAADRPSLSPAFRVLRRTIGRLSAAHIRARRRIPVISAFKRTVRAPRVRRPPVKPPLP